MYTIDLRGSNQFDSILRLENSARVQVAFDEDAAASPNARIIYHCPRTDNYRVIGHSLDHRTGITLSPFGKIKSLLQITWGQVADLPNTAVSDLPPVILQQVIRTCPRFCSLLLLLNYLSSESEQRGARSKSGTGPYDLLQDYVAQSLTCRICKSATAPRILQHGS